MGGKEEIVRRKNVFHKWKPRISQILVTISINYIMEMKRKRKDKKELENSQKNIECKTKSILFLCIIM